MTTARRRILYLALALSFPALAVGYANAVYTYNHFYDSGAFMLDSGWFSQVVHHRGITLANPPIGDGHPTYFSLHISLLFVVLSLLSYLAPLDRIDWFCVAQGLVHAPLGAAVALLLTRDRRPRTFLGVAAVAALGLLFGFDGQALACMGYPHYEVFLSAGLCVLLAGLATARPTLAWVGFAMAVGTREDGGVHVATFVAAATASDLLGRPFRIPRRTLLVMGGLALVCTAAMMLAQRRLFHGASLFQHEYLGEPPLAHLSGAVIAQRFRTLFHASLFVVVPFGATVVIAGVMRDARYLLGWAAGIPWFVLNFLAHQEAKSEFAIYTGFPFIASLFWIGAYGISAARPERRLAAPLAALGAASALSIVSVYAANPLFTRYQAVQMSAPRNVDAPAIRAFARELRADPNMRGRLLTDPSVAALATESLAQSQLDDANPARDDYATFGGFAYFRTGLLGGEIFTALARGRFTSCGRLPRTQLTLCERPGRALPDGFEPVAPFVESLVAADGARLDGDHLVVTAGDATRMSLFGPVMKLGPHPFRARVSLQSVGPCPEAGATRARVTAFVFATGTTLAEASVPLDASPRDLDFDIPDAAHLVVTELRFHATRCAYRVTALDVVER